MKRSIRKKIILGVLGVLFIAGVGETLAQKPTLHRRTTTKRAIAKRTVKPAEPVYSVASGTMLHVRMNQTINSKTARVGDTFTTTVTEPVYSANGVVVIPVGATLTGRVNSVTPATKGGKPGQIDVAFTRLNLPNGRSRYINGSLTDIDANKTRSDNEGGVSGKKMSHRKEIFIGGGLAAGAIIGGAIGGGKGALIGALLGAAGGYAGERYTKGTDAEVRSGTEFGVFLNQGISLPRFAETGPVRP